MIKPLSEWTADELRAALTGGLYDPDVRHLDELLRRERERCAEVCEKTEVDGGYTGRTPDGETFWESNAEATLRAAAARIRGLS